MATVVFDVEKLRALHPGFTDEERCTDEALEACFAQACELVGNGDDCLIPYEPDETPPILTRQIVLDLVTCHIATQSLMWGPTLAVPLGNAAEGAVSTGFQALADANDPAWWMSTPCGAQAWQILRRYGSGPIYFGVEHFYFGG